VDLDWACFCTLKMARTVLPDLDNRKLDTLAEHYGLSFAARHRSIGDAEVTLGVLQSLIAEAGVSKWGDLQGYTVTSAP
jgi:DNA polymerase III epsilon subunit-like protein